MNILRQDPPLGAGHIAIYGQGDTLLLYVPLSIDTVDTAARCAGRAWRSVWSRLAPLRQESGPFSVLVEVGQIVTLAHFGMTHAQLAALVSRKLLQADAVAVLPPVHNCAQTAGMVQRGVVAVEAAIIMSVVVVALVAGCSQVSSAVSTRWPGVTLTDVMVELIDFAAERVQAKKNPPPPAI